MEAVERRGSWRLVRRKPGVYEVYEGDAKRGIVVTPEYDPPETDEFLFETAPVRKVDSREELLAAFEAKTPDPEPESTSDAEQSRERVPTSASGPQEPVTDGARASRTTTASGDDPSDGSRTDDTDEVSGWLTDISAAFRQRFGSPMSLTPPPIEFVGGLLVTAAVLVFDAEPTLAHPGFAVGVVLAALGVVLAAWTGFHARTAPRPTR